MRKATSSEGEYLPASMALMVWRVTPTRSPSACCVISPCAKRSWRMELVTRVGAMSGPSPVVHDAGGVLDDLRQHEGHENHHAQADDMGADHVQGHEHAADRPDDEYVVGDADGLE